MADILKFPGREDPPKKKAEESPEVSRLEIMNKLADMLKYLAELRNSDPRSYDERNIDARKNLYATMTKRECEDILLASNKFLWKERPSFYHALVKILREKGWHLQKD